MFWAGGILCADIQGIVAVQRVIPGGDVQGAAFHIQGLLGVDGIAFAGVADPELRITFDTNIRWRTTQLELSAGDHGVPAPDDRVLLEVKLPGICPLWLAHALAEAGAVPVSFSKYGSCYCYHLLREQPVTLKEVFPCA